MKNLKLFPFIIFFVLVFLVCSCIEDGYTTSPSDQPDFSVDTLKIGTVYTGQLTVTTRMTVYNRHAKSINLDRVALSGDNAGLFRLNVDGIGGDTFSNVEIRANDSIFVFVDATLPENGMGKPQEVNAKIDFTANGVTSSVVLSAFGQDIRRLKGEVLTADATFDASTPYQITDSLVVEEGATLTILPGSRLLFHDKAKMVVRGSLQCLGTAESPIILTGDRTGEVIPGVSFDLMSRQWSGIDFWPSPKASRIEYTEVSNTMYGVAVYGDGFDLDQKMLTLVNSKLRNSGDCVLAAINASVEAYGCEFAEGANGLIYLLGGDHRFDQCTVSNHYLFAAVGGPAWALVDPNDYPDYAGIEVTKALITNTITWGIGSEVNKGDFTGYDIYFNRCLFKSAGTDDANFIDCIWDADPLFYTVRNDYVFDYRLKPESPAIGAAFTALSEQPLATDFYGVKRNADLGAYSYVEPVGEE